MSQEHIRFDDVPKMPEGYYSGDKPNPHLRAFVEAHIKESPYDPDTDDYDVPAFDKSIETTKATAIYNMHTYWSKKPHDAIRQYIRHYTKPGDLVLDPFSGSGGTALAALIEGRKAIAIDRSPAATFIGKSYCTPVDVDDFMKALNTVKTLVSPYFDNLYNSTCPNCGAEAITGYTVYSQQVECLKCLSKVPIYPNGDAENRKCEKCSTDFSGKERPLRYTPVRETMRCIKGCGRKSELFGSSISAIKQISIKLPEWYINALDGRLKTPFPRGLITRQPIASGALNVEDIYTPRNLLAGKILFSVVCHVDCSDEIRDLLKYVFNGICLNISMMLRETTRAIQSGTYYLPPLFRELHVWNAFEYKATQAIKGVTELNMSLGNIPGLIISTQSAVCLDAIPTNSIDYIFTDPPYGAKVQFAEANFVWELWQGFDTTWWEEEIIVNEPRQKGEDQWFELMTKSLSEAYRVLKPGRIISICFHGDTSIWSTLQDTLSLVGFLPQHSEHTIYIDAKEKSYKQRTADNVQLRDLVINFRKPKHGEIKSELSITGAEDAKTFNEKVQTVIREYLEVHPGATKDRTYDEVVSHMVRTGRMEAHDFEGLLRQVADEVREPVKKTLFANEDPNLFGTHEISRWYLKETEFTETDAAESAKEDGAAERIAAFIAKKLQEHPEIEGVHYSDIFEQYIYSVKDKPRRQLTEWLLDYFYKTDTGTYRLPQSDEEKKIKAEGRAKGTHRRVKRFIAYLQQGVAIPAKEQPNDATLAEWLRYCKRSSLYEQGKLLYEKGGLNLDSLTEEAMVNAEEDYQVCVRMLTRAVQKEEGKKKRRGK